VKLMRKNDARLKQRSLSLSIFFSLSLSLSLSLFFHSLFPNTNASILTVVSFECFCIFQNEAEALLYNVDKSLNTYAKVLSPDEQKVLRDKAQALRSVLDSGNLDKIQSAKQALEQESNRIFESAYRRVRFSLSLSLTQKHIRSFFFYILICFSCFDILVLFSFLT
jgi:hypothetical protein